MCSYAGAADRSNSNNGPLTTDNHPISCDSCGRALEPGAFYVVRLDVFADPAMPPIDTSQPIAPGESVDELLAELKAYSDEELQDQIHRRFEYRVCPSCQRVILKNPLGLPRRGRGPSRN